MPPVPLAHTSTLAPLQEHELRGYGASHPPNLQNWPFRRAKTAVQCISAGHSTGPRTRDACSTVAAGAFAPLPSANGGEGGKICPFEIRYLDILSVLYLQQMLPKLPFLAIWEFHYLKFSSGPSHCGPFFRHFV